MNQKNRSDKMKQKKQIRKSEPEKANQIKNNEKVEQIRVQLFLRICPGSNQKALFPI